jgi:hypothetical protein
MDEGWLRPAARYSEAGSAWLRHEDRKGATQPATPDLAATRCRLHLLAIARAG